MKKICSVLPMILALGLSAGVMTAFRACPRGDEGMWMHCHDAQILIFVIGLFMAAAAAGAAMLRRFGMIFAIAGMAAALICFFIPGNIIHMCMMENMRCHALMKPFAKVMCILYLIFEMIVLVSFFINKQKQSE